MLDQKFDLLGPALNDVGREAVRLTGGDPDGIFLYVEIGEGWVGPSLFKEQGITLRYIDPQTAAIDRLIIDAWCLEPVDKRWTSMAMTIKGGRFAVQFDYNDLEHSSESIDDRRQRILHSRFGERPVIYPPLRGPAWELKPPG